MKNTLLIYGLVLALGTPATAADAEFDFDSEPSAEEVTGGLPKPHEGEKGCREVSLDLLKVSALSDGGNLYLSVRQDGKQVSRFEPFLDGPGNKCLKLKDFEKEKIVVLELCHGIAGTSVLVERHSLLVLKANGRRLSVVGEVDLKYVEREGDGVKTEYDRSYKLKRKDGRIVITTKDRSTKREATFRF